MPCSHSFGWSRGFCPRFLFDSAPVTCLRMVLVTVRATITTLMSTMMRMMMMMVMMMKGMATGGVMEVAVSRISMLMALVMVVCRQKIAAHRRAAEPPAPHRSNSEPQELRGRALKPKPRENGRESIYPLPERREED